MGKTRKNVPNNALRTAADRLQIDVPFKHSERRIPYLDRIELRRIFVVTWRTTRWCLRTRLLVTRARACARC
jgi:hypothetical protein